MNKTYHSIWNESLGAWVAVAEISARGKPNASQQSGKNRGHKRFRVGSIGGAVFSVCLGWTSLPAVAGYGIFINDGTDTACNWTFDTAGVSVIGNYGGANPTPTSGNSTSLGGLGAATPLPSETALGAASSRCALTDKATQTDRALFYGPSSGVGATSLTLGGELYVNSGNLGLGGGGNNGAMRIGSASTLDTISGQRALAIGGGVTAETATRAGGDDSVAIGTSANAASSGAVAVGLNSNASGGNTVAIGSGARANGGGATAFGSNANAVFGNDMAFGTNAVAKGSADATGPSTAFGNSANASGSGSTAFGTLANAQGSFSSAFGYSAQTGTGATNGLALGTLASAMGDRSTAIGSGANATGAYSVALGRRANSFADGSTAIGSNSVDGAKALATDSIAVGGQSSVTSAATSGIAIGHGAISSNTRSVALGDGALTAAATNVPNATVGGVTYGNFAGAVPVGVVSVGVTGAERQVTNVAAGQVAETSTDAINGSQLYSGLSTTDSNLVSLSTSTSTGLSAATSGISSLSTGLSTVTSGVGSLSTALTSQITMSAV